MRWSPSCRSKRNPSCSNTRIRRWKWTGRMAGMLLFNAHSSAVDRHKFWGSPSLTRPFIASFLEDVVERSHVGACSEKTGRRVPDVPPRFLMGRAAARHVQSRHVGDIGFSFLENMRAERKVFQVLCPLSKKKLPGYYYGFRSTRFQTGSKR